MPRTSLETPLKGLQAGSWPFALRLTNQPTNYLAIQLTNALAIRHRHLVASVDAVVAVPAIRAVGRLPVRHDTVAIRAALPVAHAHRRRVAVASARLLGHYHLAATFQALHHQRADLLRHAAHDAAAARASIALADRVDIGPVAAQLDLDLLVDDALPLVHLAAGVATVAVTAVVAIVAAVIAIVAAIVAVVAPVVPAAIRVSAVVDAASDVGRTVVDAAMPVAHADVGAAEA